MEHGGLNPILPFLGGRSDAARRLFEAFHRESPFYQLARLAIASLVGAMPSVASARPNPRRSTPRANAPPLPRMRLKISSSHALGRTCAVPTQHQGRFILGFRNEIRGYTRGGTAQVRRRYEEIPCHTLLWGVRKCEIFLFHPWQSRRWSGTKAPSPSEVAGR